MRHTTPLLPLVLLSLVAASCGSKDSAEPGPAKTVPAKQADTSTASTKTPKNNASDAPKALPKSTCEKAFDNSLRVLLRDPKNAALAKEAQGAKGEFLVECKAWKPAVVRCFATVTTVKEFGECTELVPDEEAPPVAATPKPPSPPKGTTTSLATAVASGALQPRVVVPKVAPPVAVGGDDEEGTGDDEEGTRDDLEGRPDQAMPSAQKAPGAAAVPVRKGACPPKENCEEKTVCTCHYDAQGRKVRKDYDKRNNGVLDAVRTYFYDHRGLLEPRRGAKGACRVRPLLAGPRLSSPSARGPSVRRVAACLNQGHELLSRQRPGRPRAI